MFLNENTFQVDSIDQMNQVLNTKGGFVEAFWNGDSKSEQKIKDLTKATIRCIPIEKKEKGNVSSLESQILKKLYLLEHIKNNKWIIKKIKIYFSI